MKIHISNDSGRSAGKNAISRMFPGVVLAILMALLLMTVFVIGCKDDDGGLTGVCDKTPPLVGAIAPTCGASGAALNQSVTATFNEAMDSSSINATSFTLAGPTGIPVAGSVSYVTATDIATFTPTGLLAAGTTYTYTVKGGVDGVKDLAGNPLTNNFSCSFTTGIAADVVAPTVASTDPVNNATGVLLRKTGTKNIKTVLSGKIVAATFSESMNPFSISTTTFTLTGPGVTAVTGSVAYAGPSLTATFTPANDLVSNTLYTATITTGAKDLAGNALASNYVWHFTTGAVLDVTPPIVTYTDPMDSATGVVLSKIITANFSEVMNPTTITGTSFTVKQGVTPVTGLVTYSGVRATFTPASPLLPNTVYTGTITIGAKDTAGNAMASNHVWIFTTGSAPDLTRPLVITTDPANAATGVPLNKVITATFSKQMDASTLSATTVTLAEVGGGAVTGAVSYSTLTKTVTFIPASYLASGATFNATITNSVKDSVGNTMLNNYVWSFSTVASLGPAQVPLGTAARFAILSNSAITNIPTSAITGDVGISPGARSSITGLTIPEVTGTIFAADDATPVPAMLIAAKNDAEIAFQNANAAVRGTPIPVSGNINGLTLVPGLYESGTSIEISPGGFLYLDAQGDKNAVFIIRSATTITTSGTSVVVLKGGAQAANIYWTAGSSITLGTNSIMKGTLIAGTSISLLTSSRLDGRALIQGASAGQVSLDHATIVKP